MIDEDKLIDEVNDLMDANLLFYDDASKSRQKTLEEVADLIYEQPKVGEWIPVEKRLPEIQQDVLVTIKRRNISYCDLAFLDDNGRWLMSRRIGYIEGNVLAWQPLPEPYRVPLEKNSKGEQND